MKIGQIVLALRADTSRLCKAMARLNKEVISQKRRWEQRQQEQVDADYERRDKLPKEPSYNSIADEIASYRPHPR